jgi:hypothetical protein
MITRSPSRWARHLARLYAARIRRAYASSSESSTQRIEQAGCVESVQFNEPEKERIADWEWAWIDLGGEG